MRKDDKITFTIGPGIRIAGRITSDPVSSVDEVPSTKFPGTMKRFPALRAQVISLRETNPANGPVTTYIRQSIENVGAFAVNRNSVIEGLDIDADGVPLSLSDLGDKVLSAIEERLSIRQHAATLTLDELAAE